MNVADNKKDNAVKVDLFLNGFNFSCGILALSALNSGLKVAFKILPDKIETSFQPELSCLYPSSVVGSFKSLSNIRFLMKCSSLFPHHFFPQRVLMFTANDNINKKLNITNDKLLGRDRESSSLAISTKKYKVYEPFSNHFSKGALVYEYRFDRNRAIADLLKLCLELGAKIVKPQKQVESQLSIACLPFNWEEISIEIEHTKWPFANNFHIEKNGFNLTFQGISDKTIVQVHFKDQAIEVEDFKQEVHRVFENLQISIPNDFDRRLNEIFAKVEKQKNFNLNEISDPNLNHLRSTTLKLIKNASGLLDRKINLDRIFLDDNEMKNENFRLIQTECEKKYDLAKQTGIDFNRFELLFYRYRNEIDELINEAYEMMNHERNPEIIWTSVEEMFLEKEISNLQ